MYDFISDLAGGPLSDWSWLKASLPVSYGGLGIRRASLHAPAAFIGSYAQGQSLIEDILGHSPSTSPHLSPALADLALAAGRADWSSDIQSLDVSPCQHQLSQAIDQACFTRLLQQSPNPRFRALALSCAIPHAGDWLRVIPSSTLGLHLLDWEFRLCLQYWLGIPLLEEGLGCSVCSVVSDGLGDHQVACGGNGDRIRRHDSLCDVLFSAAQSAALAPRKEVPFLISGACSRPADVYLPCWVRGQPAAFDVTVISPLQQLTVQRAALVQGHALTVGEERKLASHSAACHSAGLTLVSLVVETIGGWSSEAVKTIRSIGRLQGQRLGLPPDDCICHLFQRLAIRLWRGNAGMWASRIPFRSPVVDGVP